MDDKTQSPRPARVSTKWPWILGSVAAAAAAGAAAWMIYEQSSGEEPEYQLVTRDGAFELRDYPALLFADTVVEGQRAEAFAIGLERLSGYANAAPGARAAGAAIDAIAMTAPVFCDRVAAGWRVRMALPAGFDEATAPTPAGEVHLSRLPARRVAVLRFGGYASDARLARKESALAEWLATRGLVPGTIEHALYNAPFVPPPLRRNEIMCVPNPQPVALD